VGDASTFVEVSSSWQLWRSAITTTPTTGPDTDGQSSNAEIVEDPPRVQVPGP
jgi:hypothetical protein